ncbi:hypothetical protein L596_025224 [Steinernema carpocapsae]|uniref:Uncharacterized protein n=1 Tax=Steinernema carpocapsae TaxID=34508 RepID=A0A4V5ZYZ1_STECR|nr:hypothetical protein L596_025224 [Steinernema carpocapsae]
MVPEFHLCFAGTYEFQLQIPKCGDAFDRRFPLGLSHFRPQFLVNDRNAGTCIEHELPLQSVNLQIDEALFYEIIRTCLRLIRDIKALRPPLLSSLYQQSF